MGDERYAVTIIALRAWAAPRRSPGRSGGSLWGLTARQDRRSTLGGSARCRLGWLKRKAMGPGLMDPPEVSVHDLREDLGPSGAGNQRDDLRLMIGAGPSPRPSCATALYSKATKVTLKLSLGSWEQPRGSANDRAWLASGLASRRTS